MSWNHLAAALAVFLAALFLSPAATATPSDDFAPPAPTQLADATDPFYLPPEHLPSDPGAVLRT